MSLQESLRSDMVPFSASHGKHVILVCPLFSDFNFDHQLRVVSAIFPSAIDMQGVGRYPKTM